MPSDSFTGTNGVALTTYSSSWALNNGNFAILNNGVRPNSSFSECGARRTESGVGADHYASVRVVSVAADQFVGPAVRLSTSSVATYYGYYTDNDQRFLFKVVSGVWTQIGPSGPGVAAGSIMRLEVTGNILTPKINGVLDSVIGQRSDTSILTGTYGICGWNNGTGSVADDFDSGEIITGSIATYYISPTGNNANNGLTASTPKLTFPHTLPLLVPGSTLVCLDGIYNQATTGAIKIDGTVQNGTSALPIVIKALNHGAAWVRCAATEDNTVVMTSRNWWVLEGLRLSNARGGPASRGGVLVATGCNDIKIERCIMHDPNDSSQWFVMQITNCNRWKIYNNEWYNFAAVGLFIENPSQSGGDHHIEGNYANPRGAGSPPAGNPVCYAIRGSSNNITENNVAENAFAGFDTGAIYTNVGNKWYNNIVNNCTICFQIKTQGDTETLMVRDSTIINNAVIVRTGVPSAMGFMLRGTRNSIVEGNTAFGNADAFCFYNDFEEGGAGAAPRSVTLNHNLALNSLGGYVGFFVTGHTTSVNDYCNAFNCSTAFNGWGTLTNNTTNNPNLGSARVFLPDGTAMKGAGLNGRDIGAMITHKYHLGVKTAIPMWNPSTGELMRHGPIIAGFNQTNSAADVHTRLNVVSGGVALPAGSNRAFGIF